MDPHVAWLLLKEQIESEQWHEAAETAENLLDWLSKGGFPAKITHSQTFDRIICESTCRAVCAWEVA